MSLRLRVATSESTGFNEWFDEIERAHKRCEALLEAGYFCWVYDTQEDLNVSPYLAVPIPMRGKTH